jgi:antitoxin ParD1/3/4
MSTMNISLPEPMKAFIDEQVISAGYSTSSEYVRDLIRRDQDRIKLKNLILEGAQSPLSVKNNAEFFNELRATFKTK